MTTEQTMTEPEVTQESEAQQTDQQEQVESASNTEQPETDTAAEEARKEAARKGFEERKAKRAREEQLKAENEYLKSIVSRVAPQQQAQTQEVQRYQAHADPLEPKLEAYFAAGRTAEEWSRDHRIYLENETQKRQHILQAQKSIESKISDYAKVNKDIFEYERELAAMVTPAVAAAIVASDRLGELVEKLVLDEETVNRLNAISDPYRLSREIIKIEDTLTKKRHISGAPAAPSTIKSRAPQSSSVDISNMSKAEYKAFRNNQRR